MSISEILNKFAKKGSGITEFVDIIDTPLGKLIAAADEESLHVVVFEDSKNLEKPFVVLARELRCDFVMGFNKVLKEFNTEINAYFKGELTTFTVPIKTFGTEFQKEVWKKLMEVSYGTTQTYGNFAKAMGKSSSHSRAVGAACGANAHVIVIPCHRIVGTGTNGGYGCGMSRKEWLIDHENKFCNKV